jgi:hypothetical protein
MNSPILSQSSINGANPDKIIDLADWRSRRNAARGIIVDPDVEEAASLNAFADWLDSPQFPEGDAPMITDPAIRKIGQLLAHIDAGVKAVSAEVKRPATPVAVPDLSSMSFQECAVALRAVARFPFSHHDDILFPFMHALWSALFKRLVSIDKKKALRFTDSVINSAARHRVGGKRGGQTSSVA